MESKNQTEELPCFEFYFNFEDLIVEPEKEIITTAKIPQTSDATLLIASQHGVEEKQNVTTLHECSSSSSLQDNNTARFSALSEKEIKSLKAEANNKNTTKSTSTWVRVYMAWATAKKKPLNIENIKPEELDSILEQFYAEVKKQNGSDYEPESLAVMQAALDRYLREKKYEFSIVRDRNFESSNKVLKGKGTKLRKDGKGNRPNASQALTREEEELLWTKGKLGCEEPEALLHTVWFLLTQHLGFRGCQEHKFAEVEDFSLGFDENGTEYVNYDDSKPTKTRPGGLRKKKRAQMPRMYATGGNRCPVKIFKKFLDHRPASMRESGALYLSTIPKPKDDIWYKTQNMGKNRIGDIMKRLVAGDTNLSEKKLTNHSGRKTVVKKLDDAGVPRSKIVSITGHRNEKSLDDYVDCMNHEQSHQLSRIISGGNASSSVSKSLQLAPPPAFGVAAANQQVSTIPSGLSYLMNEASINPLANNPFPVINLSNLAQNMKSSTINFTLNNNFYAQQNCTPQSCTPSSTRGVENQPQKKRRFHFLDSDSD